MKMTRVSEHVFDLVLEWLQGANNYIGRSSHDLDGESYYMRVDGTTKLAADHFWDDVGHGCAPECWRVDDTVLQLWREKFGYTVKF